MTHDDPRIRWSPDGSHTSNAAIDLDSLLGPAAGVARVLPLPADAEFVNFGRSAEEVEEAALAGATIEVPQALSALTGDVDHDVPEKQLSTPLCVRSDRRYD